ncbi:MerR family transcriptional regulator [Photobacterium galatheae]|uniref:MerR family transcriptional regulator n=1 Tax=Photobacterium galatheae TaxID=1654360 RepID=UPI0006899919|nr:MerR family DNA-binding transcriptional regulator [Photobacterium galatheae]MCM0149808.1 MerR family DNA-binding transcriptional regulator [Photobacterium galatheae]
MADTFKISELAKEFGVTTRSIRFYEDVGLLQPERDGTIRVYQRRDKTRLKLILRGKRLGFSLAEIRELFDLYDTNQSDSQLQQMIKIIDDKQAKLQRQLDDIEVMMQELNTAKARCQQALDDKSTNRKRRKNNHSQSKYEG